MNIVLLEDQQEHQTWFAKAVEQFEKRYGVEFSVHIFGSIGGYQARNICADILFLDIGLGDDMDGIAFAKQLRMNGEDAAIVIISSFDNRHKDAIKAGITRYIEKPYRQDEFDEALLAAIRSLQTRRSVMEAAFNGRRQFLKIYDIVYIENYKKRRIIHLADNTTLETTSSWEQIIGQLPEVLFCYIQKNLLINLHNLRSSTAGAVTVTTGQTINISRSSKKSFERAYARYVEVLTWEANFLK